MAKTTKSKKSKSQFTAKTNKHILYQYAVQDPPTEVRFITRVFKKVRGRKPMSIREDFCGTALFCRDWVKSDRRRTAVGIDLDPAVLAWGVENNLSPINEPGNRIQLLQQDVRAPLKQGLPKGGFDVAFGFNFSYWVFRTRDDLRAYFKSVRDSLAKDGLFFLDAYGGYESMIADDEEFERRKVEPDGLKPKDFFYYIWHQADLNPIDHSVVNHIHFEFRDGKKMSKAFTYEWRFWTLPEIQEVLLEAGFKAPVVYWEDEDEDGDGTGTFRPRTTAVNDPSWVCYIMAQR